MDDLLFGIDIWLQEYTHLKSRRMGFVTNSVAHTRNDVKSVDALLANGFNVVKLFSPEHGFSAAGEDGVAQAHSVYEGTTIPVISLYGDRLAPSMDDLKDVDLLLFDIPDVGCRFYTYLWTMTYVMEAAAAAGKPLFVLDRPNPLGGDPSKIEGPGLNERKYSSFIGRWDIPIRHNKTLGELATYFNETKHLGVDLTVVNTRNWDRMAIAPTNWIFRPTSPAIPNWETAMVYPGMGLLEGIEVNEGRGTPYPFRIFGAPWMNPVKVLDALRSKALAGVRFEHQSYVPEWGLFAGEVIYGMRITVTDYHLFKPVATGIALLKSIYEVHSYNVPERLYKTVVNPSGKGHLEKLLGCRLDEC